MTSDGNSVERNTACLGGVRGTLPEAEVGARQGKGLGAYEDGRSLVVQRSWLPFKSSPNCCMVYLGRYSAPTTLKSWLTKTWCGQLTPM